MTQDHRHIGKELYDAVGKGNVTLVSALLNDPDFRKEDLLYKHYYKEGGQTSLYKAVLEKNIHIVQMLVEAGADINEKCYNGFTPLNAAVDQDDGTILKYLYEHGGNPYIKNSFGRDTFGTAHYKSRRDIADFLKKAEEEKRRNDPNEIISIKEFNQYTLKEVYSFEHLIRINVLRDKTDNSQTFHRENFTDIQNDDGLQKAFNEHAKRGGKVPEHKVFPDRIVKKTSHLSLKKGGQ